MTQNKQDITVGGIRIIGAVSVDSGAIRSSGGPIRPQLIIPLSIQLNSAQNDEATFVVYWVGARLSTEQNASPNAVVCQPISHQLMTGFPSHSNRYGPMNHSAELRFFLGAAEVEDIERQRHATEEGIFTLYLGLDVMVANSVELEQTPKQIALERTYGTFSQLLPFWMTQVSPVMVQIEQSRWVNSVLPGLGYDRSRLIEMKFPPPLPDRTSAATQFDKAKRALDERRYGDCILACRGLLNMWETQYGANKNTFVAEIISDQRNWLKNDVRRKLLDNLWREVGDVANAPAHPEGHVDSELFDGRDARLLLLLTAALSEYVEQ